MRTSNRAWIAALLGAAVSLLSVGVQGEIPAYERVRVLPKTRDLSDAQLTSHEGKPFRLTDLRGRVAFVLFGFTSCKDVCPLAMERLRALADAGTLAPDDVAYVLISVDGERDTPAALRDFLARYSRDFIGLTAEPADVKSIAAEFSAAFFKGHAGHDGHYDVAHSPQVFVLDTNGRLRAEVYGASVESMTGVAHALLGERL